MCDEERLCSWVLKKDKEEGEPLLKYLESEEDFLRGGQSRSPPWTEEEIWKAEMRDYFFYRALAMDLDVTMFSSTF